MRKIKWTGEIVLIKQISSNIEKREAVIAAYAPQGLQSLVQRISQPLVIGIILFGAAMAFNLYRLGVPSIWFDEAFSVELARQPLPLLWHIIFGPEPNMELYYLFLHFWLGLTSLLGLHPVEFVVRFPSAVFAALSSVVVFLLGQRFIGTMAGMAGSSLYLLNDLQLIYAQQTRSYSLQLLLICISWYALLAALIGNSHARRWWVCYVVATALAIYAHLFSVLIVLAQLVVIVSLLLLSGEWSARARKQIVPVAVSLAVTAVLIIPMLLVSLQGPKTGWLSVPDGHDLLHLFQVISGKSRVYLLAIVVCCMLGVVIVALTYFVGSTSNKSIFGAFLPAAQQKLPVVYALLCWFAVPIVVSYVVSHGPIQLFSTRYLVTIVPPLCLLVGMGVAALRWRVLQGVLALGLLLLALSVVPVYYASAQVEDWNSTSHWIEQHYQSGDGLVCYHNGLQSGCQVSVEYYLHAYPSAAHFTADAPGAFSWANYGTADPTSRVEAAVNPVALAVYGAKHPRLFFILGRVPDDIAAARAQAAQVWLDTHYHLVGQINTRTVTVRLYATSATL
ncbi:MAG: glycosyltransferase family 39 protein [Ktedonobacteraceae bacterium]|nr:glycosyltransferase family 39 protein [Ktedonobacteraceae bacterium]